MSPRRFLFGLLKDKKELADNQTIWKLIKCNIRAHVIQYSKRWAKEESDKEKTYVSKMNTHMLVNYMGQILGLQKQISSMQLSKSYNCFPKKKTKGIVICVRAYKQGGRRGGLVVSALNSGASAPGLSPGRGHCVVFLGKTLYCQSTLRVPLSLGTGQFDAGGNSVMD